MMRRSSLLLILGWAATLVMTLASVAMLATSFA